MIGTHGLYIRKDNHAGVLLPQVATEYGWDVKTFLEQVSMKAGLSKDAWKENDARLYRFSAERIKG
jgi:AMMECR1 domain-containing protein